jgi:hypothetical protein
MALNNAICLLQALKPASIMQRSGLIAVKE